VETSIKLATPRSGVQRLHWVDGRPVTKEQGQIVSAWQSPEKGAPKRVVIRCDGVLSDEAATRDAQGQLTTAGFPCAVLEVRYTIGGLTKKVLVDALSQSALAVWAESVDVEPVWDMRRIARIADSIAPCQEQLLAATANSNQGVGDTGVADARWLDAIHQDFDEGEGDPEWSIHPIPEGARGVRILNAKIGGTIVSLQDAAEQIIFSADSFPRLPNGAVEYFIDDDTVPPTSIIIVPTVARFLFLAFNSGTIATFDSPAWIEWIMAPATLPGN